MLKETNLDTHKLFFLVVVVVNCSQFACVVLDCTLMSALCRNEAPAITLEVLQSLASVRRFNMAVMFMSSAEKKGGVSSVHCFRRLVSVTALCIILIIAVLLFSPTVLKEVFDFLHQAELEGSSVTALQKKYGV